MLLIKNRIWIVAFCIVLFSGCNQQKRPDPNFYENLFTGEIMNASNFESFFQQLHVAYADSTDGKAHITFHAYGRRVVGDSIIQPFKYSVRVGKDYFVRATTYEKIGMKVEPQTFSTIDGATITVGGIQDKPTLLNFWFVECPGCIAEIPALNYLQEKYAGKVNFIAMTFETQNEVEKFLRKKLFNFAHVSDAESFIKQVGSFPYPENIFIDTLGYIKYIEGPFPVHNQDGSNIDYIEAMIDDLLASGDAI